MAYYEPYHPFGGINSAEYNALNEAIIRCAEDQQGDRSLDSSHARAYSHYDWVRQTQKHQLVIQLVDKLHELGYQIQKTDR